LRYGGHAAPRRETSPARGPTVGEQQKRRSLAGDEPVEVRARLDALLHVERTEDVKIAIRVYPAREHELGASHPDWLARLPDRCGRQSDHPGLPRGEPYSR